MQKWELLTKIYLYRSRFISAMDNYFVLLPDYWYDMPPPPPASNDKNWKNPNFSREIRIFATISFYCRIIGMIYRHHHHLLRAIRIEKKCGFFPGNPDFGNNFVLLVWYAANTSFEQCELKKKKKKSVENRRKSPKTTGIRATKIEKKIFDQDISLLETI